MLQLGENRIQDLAAFRLEAGEELTERHVARRLGLAAGELEGVIDDPTDMQR